MIADVKIGDKWMNADLGLICRSKDISLPEAFINIIPIPGSSAAIDLTKSNTGDIEYNRRTIQMIFDYPYGEELYFSKCSQLSNLYHGQSMIIKFNKDPGWYWTGRIIVSSTAWSKFGPSIALTATVDPYKYESQPSYEPWIWDDFNFVDGIIRDYFDIVVPGTLVLEGRRKRVCPAFICSNAMTVTYLGNTYNLTSGRNVVPEIFLGLGSHTLTFGGSGTVDIDYVGGSL